MSPLLSTTQPYMREVRRVKNLIEIIELFQIVFS